METAVGGKAAKGAPALIYVGRSGLLKAAHIVTEEAESRRGKRQSPANGLCHGSIGGTAIAAPMYGEFLRTNGGTAGKQAGIALAVHVLNGLVHGLVVQVGIVIVHPHGVGAVVIDHVGGDALAEIGFDGEHAHTAELPDLIPVPTACLGVGKVYDAVSALPGVGLEHVTVRPL